MLVARIIDEAVPKETAAARLHQVGLFTLIFMLQGEEEPVTAGPVGGDDRPCGRADYSSRAEAGEAQTR